MGLTLVMGAGLGLIIALLVWDGAGIAIGMAVGAALGVVVGAARRDALQGLSRGAGSCIVRETGD